MVYRLFVEKKPAFRQEGRALLNDMRSFLGVKALEDVRVVNRYDVEHISGEVMDKCVGAVFSEPQVDDVTTELDTRGYTVFATEYLPGQFDQRADSAAQCVQLVSQGEKPAVRTAKIYLLRGDLSENDLAKIKKHLMNPVESREASLELPATLETDYPAPPDVAVLEGFLEMDEDALEGMLSRYGLAMDLDDLKFCQDYFKGEGRCPTFTELKLIDTYWSDHCRHTTFSTELDHVQIESPAVRQSYKRYLELRAEVGRASRPVTLMDLATIGAKVLKKRGMLPDLDESEEINACSVKITVDIGGRDEQWLLMFKNETHNHPTEIEPFGGAATCLGGAIRDPLSGRS